MERKAKMQAKKRRVPKWVNPYSSTRTERGTPQNILDSVWASTPPVGGFGRNRLYGIAYGRGGRVYGIPSFSDLMQSTNEIEQLIDRRLDIEATSVIRERGLRREADWKSRGKNSRNNSASKEAKEANLAKFLGKSYKKTLNGGLKEQDLTIPSYLSTH